MNIKEIKKKNGTTVYRTSVYLGVDQITGKKVKTSITGRTKKEVKLKSQQVKQEFISGGSTRFKTVDIRTYKELSNLWLENYQHTVKPQTYKATLCMLNKHLLPKFGDLPLEKIRIPQIQQFINSLSTRFVHYKTVNSINRRILQYGMTLQIISYNPAREVILPKKQKCSQSTNKFIDNKTIKRLMSYMEELSNKRYGYYLDYILYSLLLATGCRFGEIVALEWSDIDFKTGTISISKTFNRTVNEVGSTKTKTGNRVISIDKKTINLLKLYQNRQRQLFLESGVQCSTVVLATPSKTYQNLATRQVSLDKRLSEIGCPRFTFHAFRHTHASLLLNAGISYKELQYRLGHANLSMTMDIYSHLSKDKEREAVSYYEKAISSL